ncbi:hypothetical protein BKA82DRAFT_155255 [Pisolithus tinctorius]|nr:hypothetical protein BKA82DRAFT_155255 [Pisolithus tinctorius]
MVPGPVAEATAVQTRKAFEFNSFAALCVTKATVPPMMKRHEGLVINIGSIVGTIKVTTEDNDRQYQYDAMEYSALYIITGDLDMELKPFDINVMLAAPADVKFNISKITFKLPPTLYCVEYEERLIEKMNLTANKDSMRTDTFAREVMC